MVIVKEDEKRTAAIVECEEFFIGSLKYGNYDFLSLYNGKVKGQGFSQIERFTLQRDKKC